MDLLPHPLDIFDNYIVVNTIKKVSDGDCDTITEIFTKAFGKQIKEIRCVNKEKLVFGVNYDPQEDITGKAIKGPHPKAPDAPEFRAFWNNMSEIQRSTTDGALLEAITLKTDDPVTEIATLALQIHFDPKVSVKVIRRDINSIFEAGGQQIPQSNPQSAFDELTTKLTTLRDLTISVSNVIPISPFLRKTAVFPYSLVSEKSHYNCIAPEVIKIIIKLEGFTAWPTKQREVVPFKVAAFLQIQKALENLHIESRTTPTGIDILFRGYVFSAVGIHNAELADFKGTAYGKQLEMLERVDRLQHANVYAMTTKYESFSVAVRAAIRWVRRNCVAENLLSHEAIELLMMHIYETTVPPKYPFTALHRFISLLYHLDESKQNVFSVLSAHPDLPREDHRPLVVVAPYCRKSEYTDRGPSAFIIKFLRRAARTSLEYLRRRELTVKSDNEMLQNVFSRVKYNWHYIITPVLKERPFPGRFLFSKGSVHGKYDVPGNGVAPKIDQLMPGFDPVRMLVDEIAVRYGQVVRIWYDEFGGTKIGLTFLDAALEDVKDAKPENMNLARMDKDGKLRLDVEDIIQQIKVIGGEIIEKIESDSSLEKFK